MVRQLMQEGYRALDLVEYQGSRVVVNASRIAFVRSETNLGPVIPGARISLAAMRVAELWRYPVKSLLGERLDEVAVRRGRSRGRPPSRSSTWRPASG